MKLYQLLTFSQPGGEIPTRQYVPIPLHDDKYFYKFLKYKIKASECFMKMKQSCILNFQRAITLLILIKTRYDVYETLCPKPFACQEGFISFQCPNLQRAIT